MSNCQSILVAAVKTCAPVEEGEGEGIVTKHGFSDAELYIRDIRIVDFLQKECRKHCLFTDEESSFFFPSDDHLYLEARLSTITRDDMYSDNMGQKESACALKSSIIKFGALCRIAAELLAEETVVDCDADTLDQAKSLALRIQHKFELTRGHTIIVFFGEDRDPVSFSISPKSVSELSDTIIEISGVVNSYLSETQVLSGFWVECSGTKIIVEGAMDFSALFKDALKTGEIIQLSVQPFGDSQKYNRARIVTGVKTGRLGHNSLFKSEEMAGLV